MSFFVFFFLNLLHVRVQLRATDMCLHLVSLLLSKWAQFPYEEQNIWDGTENMEETGNDGEDTVPADYNVRHSLRQMLDDFSTVRC